MTDPLLSIIVPCYNEADNIPGLLEAFAKAITRDDVKVLLVNNGSTDHSQEVFDRLIPDYPFAELVNVPVNKGYGFGIMSGLRAAQTPYLGWTHADLQTDPADVVKALEMIEQSGVAEKIYVKGDRKRRPAMDQFFTIGMSFFETIYLKTVLWDINAQPNIFHQSFFKRWQAEAPDDFSLDLFVLYKAKKLGLVVKRFPVLFPERVHGQSKWNTGFASKWKFIKRTLSFSTQLKKNLS